MTILVLGLLFYGALEKKVSPWESYKGSGLSLGKARTQVRSQSVL